LVEDVHKLSLAMKTEYPTLPLILFGHSMGSFIARAVLEKYADDYASAVICGTGGPDTPAGAGKLLASLLIALRGERHRSPFVTGVAFGTYNKKFEKGCDKNAWLTRDTAIVDRYNADPFCTYTFTLRGYHDLFTLVGKVNRRAWFQSLPKDLPLLVVSGAEDPVGSWGKGVSAVAKRLQGAGMKNATLRLYPEMRHEILNEIGKEQVWKETLEWMEQLLS
jgi:alpha-beta hydrolase superfamily lysophospholipase